MVETELKFSRLEERVPAREEIAAAFLGEPFTVVGPDSVTHMDRYFDDTRASLSRVGLALRTRMAEGRMVATLKTLGTVSGALHRREELELPLPDDASASDPWPSEIAERIRLATDPRSLQRIMELTTERVRYRVRAGERLVAIASFDEVQAVLPHAERSAHWSELEVEAIDAHDDEELHAAAAPFQRLLALAVSSQTKLERARAVLALGEAFGDDLR